WSSDVCSSDLRCAAWVEPGDPDAEILVASGWVARLRDTGSDRSAHQRALGPVPMMATARAPTFATIAVLLAAVLSPQEVSIPLPEHPRPDFQRDLWQNLNGPWQFQFDAPDSGEARGWFRGPLPEPRQILVPFPWGGPASAVIAWYARSIIVPAAWAGRRVFLVIGAADWRTTAWLDGQKLGTHDGGYIPFEFELTKYAKAGQSQRLVLRIDDTPRAFKLEGKQGYGNARGIWQTPYLEGRGSVPLRSLHFSPDLDGGRVVVAARLLQRAPRDLTLTLRFKNAGLPTVSWRIPKGADHVTFEAPIPHA